MSEIKVWIARDGEIGEEGWRDLWLYDEKPERRGNEWVGLGTLGQLPLKSQFPEIKNGECYEATIVLGEKI